ncbi:hypothetical protein F5Y01DRAFT_319800 [Xylaria sp. FL0043]|nr:hypothetical protein F5Y01DRAFT_319800 [Xylaria sp. FL0043]
MYFSKVASVLLATPIMMAIAAPVLEARKADDAVPDVWGSAITAPSEDTKEVAPIVWGLAVTSPAEDNAKRDTNEVTPDVWGSAITAPSEES